MDTNYLLYGKKYPALFGTGNCCGNEMKFGVRPENRFPKFPHTPSSPTNYFMDVSPNLINLEGSVDSFHNLSDYVIWISAIGSPSGDISVYAQGPTLGSVVGGLPSLSVNLYADYGYQAQLNGTYKFPTSWSPGTTFVDQINFYAFGNPNAGFATLNINGYVPGTPAGVGDYITLNGPSIFSAVTGNLNPNCPPQQFCPLQYSAQFFDLQGNGSTMPNWNWTLELKRPQGFMTVRSYVGTTFPYSDFIISAPLNVSPLVSWERNPNGNVIGRITVSGLDSDGYPQYATMNIEVTGIAQRRLPFPVITGQRPFSAS
jgi:hypothetical protein